MVSEANQCTCRLAECAFSVSISILFMFNVIHKHSAISAVYSAIYAVYCDTSLSARYVVVQGVV